jgi:hypothetical protein
LASSCAIVPHFFQALDALFRPGHLTLSCSNLARPSASR